MIISALFLTEARGVRLTEGRLFQVMETKLRVRMMINVVVHFTQTRILQLMETIILIFILNHRIVIEDRMEAVMTYLMHLEVRMVLKMAAKDVFQNVSLKKETG